MPHAAASCQVVLPEIHKTLETAVPTAEARDKLAEVQGQLCGVLQVIVQKLSEQDDTKVAVLQYADQVRWVRGGRLSWRNSHSPRAHG